MLGFALILLALYHGGKLINRNRKFLPVANTASIVACDYSNFSAKIDQPKPSTARKRSMFRIPRPSTTTIYRAIVLAVAWAATLPGMLARGKEIPITPETQWSSLTDEVAAGDSIVLKDGN